jgi:alkylmercury lyase
MDTLHILNKLNSILPLKAQQENLDDESRLLHHEILRSFVQKGRMISNTEMNALVSDVKSSLDTLASKDLIVLDSKHQPVSAYPFTTQERVHNIAVNGKHIHALCAIDALAVSPMFGYEVQIKSICDISDAYIEIQQRGNHIINISDTNDIHVGINWGTFDKKLGCANSLCNNIVFLKGSGSISEWSALDYEKKQILELQQAVDLAAEFFKPIYNT